MWGTPVLGLRAVVGGTVVCEIGLGCLCLDEDVVGTRPGNMAESSTPWVMNPTAPPWKPRPATPKLAGHGHAGDDGVSQYRRAEEV